MSYYDMDCDYAIRAKAREEAWHDDHPHNGDRNAARLVKEVLTPDVRKKLEAAAAAVWSDEGSDALAKLIDETLPAIDLWISACEDEGEA